MAFPELVYKGATLIVDGRVIAQVSVDGWVPKLKIKAGEGSYIITGAFPDIRARLFSITLPKEVTELLPQGTHEYELFLISPSQEEFVLERGKFEVRPRL